MMKNLVAASASSSPLLLLSRALLLLWMPDVLRLLSFAVSEALAQPVADVNNSNIKDVQKLPSEVSPATAAPHSSYSPAIADVTAPEKPARRPQRMNAAALPLRSSPPAPVNAVSLMPQISVVSGAETKAEPNKKPPAASWLPQQPSAVEVLAQRQNQLLGNLRHSAGNNEKEQSVVPLVAPLHTPVSTAVPTGNASAGAENTALVAQASPDHSGVYTPAVNGPAGVDRAVADSAAARAGADRAAAAGAQGGAGVAGIQLTHPLPSSVARADISEIGVHSPLTYLSSPLSVQTQEKETKQHAMQQHLQHHDRHKQSRVTYAWPPLPPATGSRATSAAVRHSPLNKGPKYEKIQVPHIESRFNPLFGLLYRPNEQRVGEYGVHEQSETSLYDKNQLSPALLDLLTKANQESGSSSIKTGRSTVSEDGRLQLPSLPALFLDLSDILKKHKSPASAVDKAAAAAAAVKQAAGATAATADQKRLAEPWTVRKRLASRFALPSLDSLLSQARGETTAAERSKETEAGVLANVAAAGSAGAAEAQGLLQGKDARGHARAAGEEGAASVGASAGDTGKQVPQTAIPVQRGVQLPLSHKQQEAVEAGARYAAESRAPRGGGGAAARLGRGGQVLSEDPAESRTAGPVAAPNHEALLKPIMPSSAAHLAWILEQMKSRPPFNQANAADRPQQKHPGGQAEGRKVIQSEKPLQLPELEPRKVGGYPTFHVEEKHLHRKKKEDENARPQVMDDQLRPEEEKSKREESSQNEAGDKLSWRTGQNELPDVIAAIAAVVKERAAAVKRAADAGGGSLFAPILVEQSQISEQEQRPSKSAGGELHLPTWEARTRSVNGSGKPVAVEGEQISTTASDTRTAGTGLTDASTIPSHTFTKADRAFPPALGPEAHGKHEMMRKFGAAKKKLKEANKRAGGKRRKKKPKSAKRRRAGQDHKIAGKHARAASAYGKPAANGRPAHAQQKETAAAPQPPATAAAEAHTPVKLVAESSAASAAVPFQQYGLPNHEHTLSAPPPSAAGPVHLRRSPATAAPVSSVPLFSSLPAGIRHADAKTRGPRSGDRPVLTELEYLERSPATPEKKSPDAADKSEASTTTETKKRPKLTKHHDFLDGQFLVSTEKEKLGTDLGIRKRIDRGDILHEAWRALKAMAATTSSSGRLLYLRLMKKLPWSWDRFVRELPPVDDSIIPEFRSIRRQLEERSSEVLIVNSPSPALKHLVRTERPEAVFSHGVVIKARTVDARRTAKSASEINGLLKIVPRSPFTLSAYAAWVSRPGVSSPMELRYEAKLRGKAAEGEGDNRGAEIDKANDWQEILKKGKRKEKHVPRSVLYVVTPRARGDIDDYIREKRYPIDVELTAAEMLYALYLLHSSGFIHRDIKLMNYFVTFDGHVVLGDFDGVWPIGIPVSTKDHLLYTKGYLAPEVDINKKYADYTEKSDIYALGICFKELHEAKPQMHNAEAFKNLYRRMTAINPEKRPTALQAMQHYYFKNVNFSTLELLKHPPPLPGAFTVNAGFYG